jgi:hypothetical protein
MSQQISALDALIAPLPGRIRALEEQTIAERAGTRLCFVESKLEELGQAIELSGTETVQRLRDLAAEERLKITRHRDAVETRMEELQTQLLETIERAKDAALQTIAAAFNIRRGRIYVSQLLENVFFKSSRF